MEMYWVYVSMNDAHGVNMLQPISRLMYLSDDY